MAAKRKPRSKKKTKAQLHAQNQMLAIVLFTLGLFLTFLSFVKGSDGWLSVHNVMLGLFGPASFFIGPIFVYISIMASFDKLPGGLGIRAVMTALLLGFVAAAFQIFIAGEPMAATPLGVVTELYQNGQTLRGGGVVSALFGLPLMALGSPGDRIVVSLIIFALLMLITRATLAGVLRSAKKPVERLADSYHELVNSMPAREAASKAPVIDIPLDDTPPKKTALPETARTGSARQKLLSLAGGAATAVAPEPPPMPVPVEPIPEPVPEPVPEPANQVHIEDILQRMANNAPPQEPVEPFEASDTPPEDASPEDDQTDAEAPLDDTADAAAATDLVVPPAPPVYLLPPPTLLREPQLAAADASTSEELRQNAQLLVDTLQSFGVQTRIIDISRGPAVTRYELQPSAGVKISKITNLADDIALNLASAGVRIEAPIPNKAAVGIEVPNRTVSPVTLREVIDSRAFSDAKSRVTMALGRDISGNVVVADIAKMPHLLIAGATGSGKSVCINTIIMSILMKARPDEVKLMLVDPKVVELGVYNGLPHLVVPVVNDAKKAAGVLGWAVTEMLNRYKTFAQHGVRDIASFNKLAEGGEAGGPLERLPHIVIVVDELSDLMMAAPAEVEDHICRLAQMARAAGMHLIIATQRPSVDVITGIIKANIPSRIAFSVSSQIDSRTILDMGGAEKLLGQGDMLFYPVGASKPVRVQGCFVSDDEIERVTDFIKQAVTVEYDQQVIEEIERHTPVGKSASGGQSAGEGGEDNELISAAIECVVEAGLASTSLLQRKCKLGYARAARVIDELEARGIVGPFEGSKPRQVLISKERWIEMKMNQMQNSTES